MPRVITKTTVFKDNTGNVKQDVYLTEDVPKSTYHIFSNHKKGKIIQSNSYALSSYTKNGHHYSLNQINSNGSNLVFPKGKHVSSTSLSANKTKMMVTVIPEGKKNYVPLMITLDNLDFEQVSQIPDHSISVSDTHLVASYSHFVSSRNNTVILTHTVTKFNLDTCKIEKKWDIKGIINLRLSHDNKGNLYMSGDGVDISVNGKSIATTGISNYVIIKIDNKNCIVWTLTDNGTSDALLFKNVTVNASSINNDTNNKESHKDRLLVTGSFINSISLDRTYNTSSNLEAMWWGEVSPNGKWVRSGILGPPSNKVETGSDGRNPFHIQGSDIFGWGEDVHVVGTYRGNVSKDLNSDQKKPFYLNTQGSHKKNSLSRREISRSIDANISSPECISSPCIKLINGNLLIGVYFDSFFTLGNVQYRNKGTHGLIFLPAPVETKNDSNNKIVKYIELGGGYFPNHSMVSGCSEILSSSNTLIQGTNLNYAHFSTY